MSTKVAKSLGRNAELWGSCAGQHRSRHFRHHRGSGCHSLQAWGCLPCLSHHLRRSRTMSAGSIPVPLQVMPTHTLCTHAHLLAVPQHCEACRTCKGLCHLCMLLVSPKPMVYSPVHTDYTGVQQMPCLGKDSNSVSVLTRACRSPFCTQSSHSNPALLPSSPPYRCVVLGQAVLCHATSQAYGSSMLITMTVTTSG